MFQAIPQAPPRLRASGQKMGEGTLFQKKVWVPDMGAYFHGDRSVPYKGVCKVYTRYVGIPESSADATISGCKVLWEWAGQLAKSAMWVVRFIGWLLPGCEPNGCRPCKIVKPGSCRRAGGLFITARSLSLPPSSSLSLLSFFRAMEET